MRFARRNALPASPRSPLPRLRWASARRRRCSHLSNTFFFVRFPSRIPNSSCPSPGWTHRGTPSLMISSADWLEWRRAPSLQGSAIYSFPFRQGIVTADSATRVSAERVSGNFFDVLKPDFVIGRPFTEDEAVGLSPVVVISESLWRRIFSADSRLGKPLRTGGRSYTIVGVVAQGREFPAGTDVWFPVGFTLATDPNTRQCQLHPHGAHASWRLPRTGGRRADDDRARHSRRRIRAHSMTMAHPPRRSEQSVVGDASMYLMLLMAVVFGVLLIVCANVAAAGMARAAARSREMAIRTSLGAVRGRLIQQLLIEHVCLGMIAGVIALFIAWASVRGILSVWGGQIPRAGEVSLDARVFALCARDVGSVGRARRRASLAARHSRFAERDAVVGRTHGGERRTQSRGCIARDRRDRDRLAVADGRRIADSKFPHGPRTRHRVQHERRDRGGGIARADVCPIRRVATRTGTRCSSRIERFQESRRSARRTGFRSA